MSEIKAPSPKGIGGWLILAVLGLIISPIRTLHFLSENYWPIFRDGVWSTLTTTGTDAYHALWAPLIAFEIIGNLVSIGLALVTLWFLLHKSRRTPKLAIGWLLWSTIFVVIDFFAANSIPAVASKFDPDNVKELIHSIVGAAIWVPYFMVSKRVKATFIE